MQKKSFEDYPYKIKHSPAEVKKILEISDVDGGWPLFFIV